MREDLLHLMSLLKQQLDVEIETLSTQPQNQPLQSNQLALLGQVLNEKRKQLGLDIQTLEWQTGISSSTLKRLFKDPSQVKFMSVVLVAETLGVELCFVK